MLSGVAKTQEQNARILALLEERLPAGVRSPAGVEAKKEPTQSETK